MIPPRDGQPGMIGTQHGLQRLTDTLEALQRGQQLQGQRDSQIQDLLTSQARALTTMAQHLRWQGYGLGVLAGLMLLLGGLGGWQLTHRPETPYVAAFGALDTTLTQQWEKLPKPVQEQLSATYGRIGLASPGARQFPKK